MRVAAVLVATVALAGCASGKHSVSTVSRTVTVTVQPGNSPLGAEDTRYFGRIVSITKADAKRWLLVLRPESFLVGVTANVASAAQQGKHCAPLSCPGVEDDRLVIPAGNAQLTFVLPATTNGTVLTVAPGGGTRGSRITASQLASLVGGAKKPRLVEPLVSGVWLAVDVDRVTSFAQQFQP